MSAPICFIDTETDGVHPDRKVWEVAMIRREAGGNEQLPLSFFVELDLDTADPFGLKVGGFYDRHPMGRYLAGRGVERPEPYDEGDEYLSEYEAACMVARWTHGAHLVGAVPSFDAEVLGNLLRSQGFIPAWHHHLIDVEAMAVGWLNGRGVGVNPIRPPWKSDTLSAMCNVDPPADHERHTALGDARWAMRWYDGMTGRAS